MNHLSLFSGIGGLDLAAEWAGFRTVAFVERDAYCQRVLAKHWPGVPILSDVRDATSARLGQGQPGSGEPLRDDTRRSKPERRGDAPRISIISGGFPCQPHSVAGKRQASADDRDLWPEFARVIREIRPRWVVAENVPGLLSSESGRFFGAVLRDLAEMGYSAGWGVWGACDVGALHRRDRVFIVAHAEGCGGGAGLRQVGQERHGDQPTNGGSPAALADAERSGSSGPGQPIKPVDPAANSDWQTGGFEHVRVEYFRRFESGMGDLADGISPWMVEPDIGRVAVGVKDRVHKLRALGNAVVPQQAYPLFKAIAEYEMTHSHSQSVSTGESR